jgi:coenzyme F420 hydrogenase subunit beta
MVDAVLHIGVSDADPLTNEYRISTTPEQVAANAGSRYAPAAPLLGLKEALARHAKIAVIGKPCDIVAVRKLAKVDTQVKQGVAYCLSFMCAGVPSIKGTHAVIKALNAKVEEVVEFRYRGNGWPGLATARTQDGRTSSMTYDDSWGKILNKHLQFRCKVCFDGTGEFADITCADAWHGDAKGYPSFSERDGRSLIITRTERGREALQHALRNGAVSESPLPIEDLSAIQPYQRDRKSFALSRLLALAAARRSLPKYSIIAMLRLATRASIVKSARNFAGTLKRIT